MLAKFEYSYIWANEHENGSAAPFDDGRSRGQLLVGALKYTFNKYWSGHMWGEYFIPGSYYDMSADTAFFLRWQIQFKF